MIDYLNPRLPEHVETVDIPLIEATAEALDGYGLLVDDPEGFDIEIVTWPKPDGREVDDGTGNEGGTTEGIFTFWWEGSTYRGRNEAVVDEYVMGWSHLPHQPPDERRRCIYQWHANYHPDGGQLFHPLDQQAFIAPLALPGDDVKPESFRAFYLDGTQGLYVHPGVWHEALYLLGDRGRFFDKQDKVHARVSVDFPKEFGCVLRVPLHSP